MTTPRTDSGVVDPAGNRFHIMGVILAVILVHRFAMHVLLEHGRFEEPAYHQYVISSGILRNPWLLVFICVGFALVVWRKRMFSWAAFDDTSTTRMFVFVASGMFAWLFSTYAYNGYYDQPHYVDRIALVVLWILTWWHPFFLTLFLVQLVLIISQFQFPFVGYPSLLTDKRMVLDCLVLFNSIAWVRCFCTCKRWLHWYLLLCLVGSVYFYAAIEKIALTGDPTSWLLENRISNLTVSSYMYGWMTSFSEEALLGFVELASRMDWLVAATTLLVETAGIVIVLSGRRFSIIVLAAFLSLHLAILCTSGIGFWLWAVVDLLLIFAIKKSSDLQEMYGAGWRLLSLGLIASAALYPARMNFGWYDTKLSNIFVLEAQDDDGTWCRVSSAQMAPYDMTFQFGRFGYLTKERLLAGTYGTTRDYRIFKSIEMASKGEIRMDEVYRRFGAEQYDEEIASRFAETLPLLVKNREKEEAVFKMINFIAAPKHFWVSSEAEECSAIREPQKMRVRMDVFLYKTNQIQQLKSEYVLEIGL